jgi:hypothetical protein
LNCQSTPRRPPWPSTTNVGPTSRIQASLLDISTTRTDGGQHRPGVGELVRVDRHRHRLGLGDRGRHGGERLLRGLRPQPPDVRPPRPQHPAAVVGLELPGHVEAVGGRRRLERARHGPGT